MKLNLFIQGLMELGVSRTDWARDIMIMSAALEILPQQAHIECARYLDSKNLIYTGFYTDNPEFALAAGLVYSDSGNINLGVDLVLTGFQHGQFNPYEISEAREALRKIMPRGKAGGNHPCHSN